MTTDLLAQSLNRLVETIEQAHRRGETEANAAALATVDSHSGRPSIRTIYVHADTDGLRFFVNEKSGKGRQLAWNPQVALCFFWRLLQQQVNVEGRAEKLDVDEADVFWRQRPRESTLAARASHQEEREGDRDALQARVHAERQRYSFDAVERPSHWAGYRLVPERLAFWDTGWHRMRIRHLVERDGSGQWYVREQEP